jgi:hypothetical protein
VSPRLLALGASMALVLTLAACGKAGSPTVPGSSFPHPYPNPKLSPTQTVPPPEDQPEADAGGKAKFTDKGSYIDPAVRDTELRRAGVAPGSTLPFTQTNTPGSNTPFNSQLGVPGASPLGSATGTSPQDEQTPE